MTRILITGGPRTGKTTLAEHLALGGTWTAECGTGPSRTYGPGPDCVRHTDDLIAETAHLGKDGWSEASRLASLWFDGAGPWIIEGVAASRALRKWHEAHPGEPPPVDRVIYLREPHETLTPGQTSMAKGVATVHRQLEDWLSDHDINTEYR